MKTNFLDIDPQLCTFCGTCVSVCPTNSLIINKEKVELKGDCVNCGKCYAVCPGIEVNFFKLINPKNEKTISDIHLGNFIEIHSAHSLNPVIRNQSSSGGVVTSLLIYLLDTNQIDGAILVGMNSEKKWLSKIIVARSDHDIIAAIGSKYCLVPLNSILWDVINDGKKYALVGLPCHIHGIRKMQYQNLIPSSCIKYTIGLFCGLNMSIDATEDIIKKLKIKNENVVKLEYRGGLFPGGLTIKTLNRIYQFHKSLYKVLNLLYVPKRCLMCCDLTNELCDISIGDIWSPVFQKDSSVIIRSKDGQNVYYNAMRKGYIDSTVIDKSIINKSHKHLIFYKSISVWSRMKFFSKNPSYNHHAMNTKITGFSFFFNVMILSIHSLKPVYKLIPINIVIIFSNLLHNCIHRMK